MTHPERVFSRSQLLDQVWGDHVFVEERTVDVHIRRLRKALEPSGHDAHVETAVSYTHLVADAYFNVLYAQDTLAATEAEKAAVAGQLESAKRNFELGNACLLYTSRCV